MKLFRTNIAFRSICLLTSIVLCLSNCNKQDAPGFNGFGKQPVYMALAELDDVKNLSTQSIENTGPIFLLDTLFFMTEVKKGIHVFNVKDSASIENVTFFNIPAITDFTISNGYLYADSWTDLLTINIQDLQNIQLINREEGAFEPLLFPPLYQGIFECVDLSLGAVVEWQDTRLDNAKCQTFF